MVISKEIYDRVVHYTDEEYKALTGDSVHVQAQVERHYLHLVQQVLHVQKTILPLLRTG